MLRLLPLSVLLLFVATSTAVGQDALQDTVVVKVDTTETIVKEKKKHSPLKATIMSAALPGLGQVYNGKWWKVPIIYGGFAGLIYGAVSNDIKRRTFTEAYLIRIDDDPNTVDAFEGRYSESNLRQLVDQYQKNRDLMLVFTGVLYALNIIDASVDAHLKDFDVSDDLSMQVRPTMQPIGPDMMPMPAVALTLRLK